MSSFKTLIEELKKLGIVRMDEPMKFYTTFRTGGPADILVFPWNASCLCGLFRAARLHGMPLTVIGGGSNLLVGDRGIRGLVVCMSSGSLMKGQIDVRGDGLISCDAIVPKEDFIDFACREGFGGVEFMAGIPGCVGGGVIMNAGTNMGNFADVLCEVDVVDNDGGLRSIRLDRKMSSYRKMDLGIDGVVVKASFALPRANDPTAVRRRVSEIIAERWEKHPMQFPSAGSVFKNPEGHSSWKLINDSGLKGRRIGGAAVSELHTNFIINKSGATSADIRNLIEEVREGVYARFQIRLETEIRMLGEF